MDINQFKQDVAEGLNSTPKRLPSKYFYDKRGDELFVEIMNMPEYYLTNAEHDILVNKSEELIDLMGPSRDKHFELIELGAGDGSKTVELLKSLMDSEFKFTYFPVDISPNTLQVLNKRVRTALRNITMELKAGDYFHCLEELHDSDRPKIVLFLGSNIGNMQDNRAAQFMNRLSGLLNSGDRVVLGVDLIKSAGIVLPAYNDAAGITRKFNLNLLHRINRELGANFVVEQFEHCPEYTQEEGIAKSFLKSTADQTVEINALNASFTFKKGERIHTEISRKYNDEVMNHILSGSGLRVEGRVIDNKKLFADYVLAKQ